jgi:quercetin dioxygenase-like cupin family protein
MKSTRVEDAPRFEPVEGADMAIVGDGSRMTLIRILVQPGGVFPDHSHPNEQIGTCMEGKGVLTSGGEDLEVEPGVTWSIPADEPHRFVATGDKPTTIYEVWSPPREDYRKMAKIV